MPRRFQRKRSKGWRMPAGAIYVGRGTKWGNQWRVGIIPCSCRSAGECEHNRFRCETAKDAVDAYRAFRGSPECKTYREAKAELRGKDLICWCALGNPCHADVLLEIANG